MYEIYLTTNLINGKKYIGQHKISKQKDYYLGSGKILRDAIKKYGHQNFKKTQIELCDTIEQANERERYWIKFYNAVNDENFYNLSEGGQEGAGFLYFRQQLEKNPEQKKVFEEKRIQAVKQWQQEHYEELTQIGQQNIQKCLQWRKEHPEEMAKIYERQKKENAKHLKDWMEANPEQAKQNREKGNLALQQWKQEHPEETRKNLALGPQANKLSSGKKVKCITTGEIFLSIRDAEKAYGIYKDGVGRCLRGIIKSAGKHPETKEKLYWEYLKEE